MIFLITSVLMLLIGVAFMSRTLALALILISALTLLLGAAYMSPILVFVLIFRNSLIYHEEVAPFTACGIALGSFINAASYLFYGGGMLNNPLFLKAFTYTGASYLIYIGYKGIITKAKAQNIATENLPFHNLLKGEAFVSGFIAHILDCQYQFYGTSAMIALHFGLFVPILLYVVYFIALPLQTFVWYRIIVFLLSELKIWAKIISIGCWNWINRITGVVLVVIVVRSLFCANTIIRF